jgi:putative peptide zinc metalloprotease protein
MQSKHPVDDPVTTAARVGLLRTTPGFGALPDRALQDLAERLVEERYAPGTTVFSEGDAGDRLFIVAVGYAELSGAGSVGSVPLATLAPGDLVGELALLSAHRRRNATLKALNPLVLLSLGEVAFAELLASAPEIERSFERHADDLLVARFVKHVGPFMTLDDASRQELAKHLVRVSAVAGQPIVRQGERGETCYMVRSGRAEVLVDDGESGERRVDVVGPGSLFGEASLLTDAPRSATVRALEPCQLLELRRDDLTSVLDQEHAVGHEIVQLLRLRERPRKARGVLVSERRTVEGETLTVLKNPEQLTYYRLSERGRFIWERIDGSRNLRELTLDVYERFGQLALDAIASVVAGLARTNMIETTAISTSLSPHLFRPTRRQRALSGVRRMVERQSWVNGIDGLVSAAYNGGIRVLFTRTGQAILAAAALAGLVAFGLLASGAHQALSGSHKELLLLIVPGFLVATFLHECGHAFTVKAFGREVNRAGVGWYWFGPVAFVDTSDMWLGSRRERILVSLAGPYTDLVVAGVVSLIALAISDTVLRALLWSFALPAYLTVLANLNPLLEYDGYYVLSDLLDRPNLRADALAWVSSRFPHLLRDRQDLRRHRVEFLYGVGSVLYVLVAAVAMVLLYRLVLQGWIKTFFPASTAAAFAWVFAALVSVLATLGLVADLRRARAGPFDGPGRR